MPFVPPKPNELDNATANRHATRHIRNIIEITPFAGILEIDGRRGNLVAIARIEKIASTAPAAPSNDPSSTCGADSELARVSPKHRLSAIVSARSPKLGRCRVGVDVLPRHSDRACASLSAFAMASRAPSPSSGGAVM